MVLLTLGALLSEYIMSWLLFFSPGLWNGWPFGLSFQTVLSVAMTGWTSLMIMTALAAVGAIAGFLCALLGLGRNHGYRAYLVWLRIMAVATICFSIWFFVKTHAWVMEEFPNGYETG
jgi:hypothetical protein